MQHSLYVNKQIELTIDSYGSEGQGVGRADGIAVFIHGAIAGETVLAKVEKTAPNYAVARLDRVIKSSPVRRDPVCPVFSKCGGCDIQHIDYKSQLELKRSRVQDALERIGGFRGVTTEPCAPAESEFRYRNKAVFGFGMHKGVLVCGCYERNSHSIVAAEDCLLQDERAFCALKIVLDWARDARLSAYDESSGRGVLKNLIVRTTSPDETMIVIVSSVPLKGTDALIERLGKNINTLRSVVNNVSRSRHSGILGRRDIVLYGKKTVRERLLGSDFEVSAQSFLQVNHSQTEKLYKTAVDLLDLNAADDVADLYCGIGTLSLLIAKHAKSVIGIEYVQSAVDDAINNAVSNGVNNAEFLCGGAEEVLPKLVSSGRRISKLLIDPPRQGVQRSALDAIIHSGVSRIVYVSCNPATLARDCKILANEGGYMIECVKPFDMFPQTGHVETVVLLSRN
ncbi:MAG: 23S rRNA (uracil(1939)-C(5))-methyltransferase RlmD [Clostridia bacterium]|nr:23S rRNA (uracil(1939)-C(5))-methyltransferase RlmD [Clostridia bacterium]